MTRAEIATLIVSHGLRTAGMTREPEGVPLAAPVDVPLAARLMDVIPGYQGPGRERFIRGVDAAGRGLNLGRSVGTDGSVTVGNLVREFASLLPVRLYRCQDPTEPHFYQQRGTGVCEIDGTTLVEVRL